MHRVELTEPISDNGNDSEINIDENDVRNLSCMLEGPCRIKIFTIGQNSNTKKSKLMVSN